MARSVTGLREVLGNLERRISDIEGATMGGLMDAGLQVQRVSQTRTPVDTGNLKGSAFTRRAMGGSPAVEVGYTAAYAVFVHEDMEARHLSGQSKFLESALRDNEDDIVRIIQSRASV